MEDESSDGVLSSCSLFKIEVGGKLVIVMIVSGLLRVVALEAASFIAFELAPSHVALREVVDGVFLEGTLP